MKKILLFFLLISISPLTYSQITGKVTDSETGEGLIAATIQVLGSDVGTITDFEGNYSIEATQGETLIVSYVGYQTQEVPITGDIMDVSLSADIASLEQVVVIGYGTAASRDLTGSIVKVDGDVVADKPASNPVASLQGRVSGLSVVNSGQVGQEPDIRIRGTSSRYSTKPLYVIDGLFADNMDFVNPNDIESIEVLKDPSSLAIFGVKGANGVIIVSTKQGKEGKTIVNFNSTGGIKNVVDAPEMANAALFTELYNERLVNEGLDPFIYYDLFNGDTDWVETISNKNAMINTKNLSIQSASEKNKISFGLGYRNEEGLVLNEKLERISLNINDELTLNDNLKIGATISGYRDDLPNNGGFASALNATPIVPGNLTDSREEYNGLYYQLPIEIGGAQIGNPLLAAEVTKNKSLGEKYRFVGSVFAELTFLENFKFRTNIYGDYDQFRRRSYVPIIPIYAAETDEIVNFNGNQVTSVSQASVNAFNFQKEFLLSYDHVLADIHGLQATAGFTTTQYNFEEISGRVEHNPSVGIIPDNERFWYLGVFPYGDPETRTSSSGQNDRATESFLGRVMYDYDGKYLFNASYRRDATSQLAPDNRAQDFWAVGAGWVVTDEDFAADLDKLDFLKLKASIGQLGNQFVPGNSNYPYYPGVNAGATAVFGNQVIPGYVQRFEENPNLQWETVKQFEGGFETWWFDNRFSFNTNYYNRLTENLLVFVDIGTAQFFDNSGEIRNKGFEFESSWEDEINENFSYSISGNLTTIDNEVVSTREDAAIFSGGISRTISGEPIGHYYGYIVDGIYQSNAEVEALVPSTLGSYGPGDFIYKDINQDGEITPDDRTLIGNPTPDFTYGFSTRFDYKKLFVDIDFQGVYGNEIYRNWGNGNSFAQFNYRAARADRWTQSGSSNWEPRLYDASEYNRLPSTYMIEDGSYFRIRNLQVGYPFEGIKIKNFDVQQIRLFGNIQNLKTWKNTSGFTPEAGGSPILFGVDDGGYPVPRISTLGVSVTF